MTDVLLEARDIKKHYPVHKGVILRRELGAVKAVDGIDLTLLAGESFGLAGGVRLRQEHHGEN